MELKIKHYQLGWCFLFTTKQQKILALCRKRYSAFLLNLGSNNYKMNIFKKQRKIFIILGV